MLDAYIDNLRDFFRISSGLSQKDKLKVFDIISEAVSQTRTFIARNREDGKDVPSQLLSHTWMQAGNQLRNIKNEQIKDLALSLFAKSQYWSDPMGYKRNDYDITLSHIETELQKLTS